jgi:hypothetical protein
MMEYPKALLCLDDSADFNEVMMFLKEKKQNYFVKNRTRDNKMVSIKD